MKQTHVQIIVNHLSHSNLLLSSLISVSSSVEYSLEIFRQCPAPDVITHNFFIKHLNAMNRPGYAFYVYNQLWVAGLWANSYTLTFLLRSCEVLGELMRGKMVHGQILRCGHGWNVFIGNVTMDFYSKIGAFEIAKKVFDGMMERDVCSWNSMISACMAHGELELGLFLFEKMPDRNTVSWNSMIRGLAKMEEMTTAKAVFDRMPEVERNELTWNTMITGYSGTGDMIAAKEIFEKMGCKNVISCTAMISGYASAGDMESMRKVFGMMPVKTTVTWNAMISGYNSNAQFSVALQTFHRMLIDGRSQPDRATMIAVVSACTQLGDLEHGKWIYSYLQKNPKFIKTVGINLGNALIDMFAKCGDIKTAESIFRQMPDRCVITWTSLISGLGLNGKCKEALGVFDEMCTNGGIKPDAAVFIAILTACTHGGLVKEGCSIYKIMIDKFSIVPNIKHHGCIVDLLGRAGKVEEAIQFIESMPVQPESLTWLTLLSSCKNHDNGLYSEIIHYVSRKMTDFDPMNSGYRVLLSNARASIGEWPEAADVRHKMKQVGVEKIPGCSSIFIGGEVHEFLVKDRHHNKRKEIYDVLHRLTNTIVAYE